MSVTRNDFRHRPIGEGPTRGGCTHRGSKQQNERRVVSPPDAVIHPLTVVITPVHTIVTLLHNVSEFQLINDM